MSVLATASGQGLTTTSLPLYHASTVSALGALPALPRHAALHRKLQRRKQLDQLELPQYRTSMDSAQTTRGPRRRSKRQHNGTQYGYLHVKTGPSYNLRILPDGTIDGEPVTTSPSAWCLLRIVVWIFAGSGLNRDSNYGDGEDKVKVYIQGYKSKYYLCMNTSGILYARAGLHDDCYFIEKTSGHRYYYMSEAHGVNSGRDCGRKHRARHGKKKRGRKCPKRWRKQWLVGLNSDGKPRPGYRTSEEQKFGAFIRYKQRHQPPNNSPFVEGQFGHLGGNTGRPGPVTPTPRGLTVTPSGTRHKHNRRLGCRHLPTRKLRRRCRRRRERERARKKQSRRPTTATARPRTTRPITDTPTWTEPTTQTPTTTLPPTTTTDPSTTVTSTVTPVKPTASRTVLGSTPLPPRDASTRPSAPPTRPSAPPTRPGAPPTRPSAPPTRPSAPPRFDDMIQGLSHINMQDVVSRRRDELADLLAQITGTRTVVRRTRTAHRHARTHAPFQTLTQRILHDMVHRRSKR